VRRTRSLALLLEQSTASHPDRPVVSMAEQDGLRYAQFNALANRVRDRLVKLGVKRGDRVGLRLHKSVDGVAAIFGILKSGAAYVPVDADSPATRGAYIHNDCAVRAVFTSQALAPEFSAELSKLGATPRMFALDGSAGGLARLLDSLDADDPAPQVETVETDLEDVAYILYTSGSTGNPKGVVLTHGNALSFIDWCSVVFEPTCIDRFSSHAPFHFDLSILDLYVSIKHGSALVLFGESLGKEPVKLAQAIASERITMWYSTPSILNLLANFGKLERHDYSALRIVNFAGEVFPLPQYRAIRAAWPHPRFFNLYGPTETNVCTWYEVPAAAAIEGMSTFPIGALCVPNRGMVMAEDGAVVKTGDPGELLISGPNVMRGYWNLSQQNERAFHIDSTGTKWYRTGDIVTESDAGFRYVSRRDRMVKRRGYRVELGEIETVLNRHNDIREAAVVAIPDAESGVRVCAFVAAHEGITLTRIALKTASSKSLPPYMIPDQFFIVEKLARTSTDKIDYQTLKNAAANPA
jgi:amino acid adenylation domain-containing protein